MIAQARKRPGAREHYSIAPTLTTCLILGFEKFGKDLFEEVLTIKKASYLNGG